MLSYETSKQLKNAGYSQKKLKGEVLTDWTMQVGGTNDSFYAPTLSELIEACGDEWQVLWKRDDGYISKSWKEDNLKENYQEGTGSSPEEAVAALWLKLNTK